MLPFSYASLRILEKKKHLTVSPSQLSYTKRLPPLPESQKSLKTQSPWNAKGTCAWHPRRHGRWRVIVVRDRLQALSYRNSNLYIRYLSLIIESNSPPKMPVFFIFLRMLGMLNMHRCDSQLGKDSTTWSMMHDSEFPSIHPFLTFNVINDFFTMPPWGILATWFQMPAWTKHSSLVRRDFWLLGWRYLSSKQQQRLTRMEPLQRKTSAPYE